MYAFRSRHSGGLAQNDFEITLAKMHTLLRVRKTGFPAVRLPRAQPTDKNDFLK